MTLARLLGASGVILVAVSVARPQERDLRDTYGTRSLEAAQLARKAEQLSKEGKQKEAVAAFDGALKADPRCQMAHFLRALTLRDLGDVAQSIDAYKTCLSDAVDRRPNVSGTAANNLALTYAKLNEYDDARLWFTRAIVEDSANRHGQRGKAYRNLALTLKNQGKSFAAAFAVALAFEDKAPNTDLAMVRKYFEQAETDEAATLLYFAADSHKAERRTQETRLVPAAVEGAIPERVADLLPDPQGRYVVAVSAPPAAHYHLITTDGKPAVREVTLPAPVVCACLTGGHRYTVAADPAQLAKVEPATGRVVETYPLANHRPASVAVFPRQNRAFFPKDGTVFQLDLGTGAVTRTSIPATVVAAHPGGELLLSYLKPERRGTGGGHIIVNGRPVFFQTRQTDWQQSTLFEAILTPGGLLLAGARDNAASNASRLGVSPDGRWVALAGGGGWRPTTKQAAAGYGVAVFDARRLEDVQGFFKTDAYPTGVAFNPVTGQVAALRAQDAKVYDVADPDKPTVLTGTFTGTAAWSGNGKYLVLGTADRGVAVYDNALSNAEEKTAGTWWKALPGPEAAPAKPVAVAVTAVDAYAKFATDPPPTRDAVAKELAAAARTGGTQRPIRWEEYNPYAADADARRAVEAAGKHLKSREDVGLGIYQLKKALAARPDSVPVQYTLARAYRMGGQADQAEKLYLAVVRADAGRTELTCRALTDLAGVLDARGQGLAAVHCLAAALTLDRADADALAAAERLLKANKFDAEAGQFARLAAAGPKPTSGDLPKLSPPPGDSKKLTSAEVYQKAAWSVVLVKTEAGTGSGVCVGRADTVLTNHHVVPADGPVEVYPFILKDRTPVRMPKVTATVVARFPKEDLAVLKLDDAPAHLEPLPVAVASPSPGERVFAVGSPGLGREVLEQSISEGLVSSNKRRLDGAVYLQHSAAVNPGNSGGPLLDEFGRVVGIVTLKARLENVGFAVPPETIRATFQSRP